MDKADLECRARDLLNELCATDGAWPGLHYWSVADLSKLIEILTKRGAHG